MKKQVWFWVLGGVAVLVVVGIGAGMYLQQLQSLPPLEISFSTAVTARPAGAPCLGGEEGGGIAKEILNFSTREIFVAGGENQMPDEVWQDAGINFPYIKNSTRYLLFDEGCFFRSPGAAEDCAGEACFSTQEIQGYSWYLLTTVAGQGCFPDGAGCYGQTVEPGYVSVTTIAKCHEVRFNGPTVYILRDGTGNAWVMHATATGTPDTENVVLPEGWTLTAEEISDPLVLLPVGGGEACYYNIARDNLVQAYHQFEFAEAVYGPQDE